jgi:hypothetical protein
MRDLPPAVLSGRHQQRKKLHGPLLDAIAAQVWVLQEDGEHARYEGWVWKKWFKGELGVPGSTEKLTDDGYEAFVWEVEVFAAYHMGVDFTEQDQ